MREANSSREGRAGGGPADRRRERVASGIWRRRDAAGRWRYEITFRDSEGRQRRQTVPGGLRSAQTALAEVQARKGRGEYVQPCPDLTFAHAASEWLSTQVAALRPATQATYDAHLRTYLLPRWSRLRLDRITIDHAARLVEEMQRAGKSAWTIQGVLVVAGRVFDFATRRLGWAGSNPVRGLDRSERPRHTPRDRRILSRDELDRLVAAANPPVREIIATAASLGTRLGETLGLVWADIDLEAGTVAVRLQLNRSGQRVELKTARSRRVIEAPGSLLRLLAAHKLVSKQCQPTDLVFTSGTGRPLDHRNVAQAVTRAAHRAGLDSAGQRAPTVHELRHAHASAWIAHGGDLVELSSRLGHRDPSITAAVYSHEFEAQTRSAERRARLDAIYGEGAPLTGGMRSARVARLPPTAL